MFINIHFNFYFNVHMNFHLNVYIDGYINVDKNVHLNLSINVYHLNGHLNIHVYGRVPNEICHKKLKKSKRGGISSGDKKFHNLAQKTHINKRTSMVDYYITNFHYYLLLYTIR